MTQLEHAGLKAMEIAEMLWRENVVDPRRADTSANAKRCKDLIDRLIRDPLGLGWSWEEPYAGDGDFEWCGAFAAWCWGNAGLSIKHRKSSFASTYRLDRWASYRPGNDGSPNPAPPESTQAPMGTRRIRLDAGNWDEAARGFPVLEAVRQGDVLLVGDGRKPGSFGSHVTLVQAWDVKAGWIDTISGNGVGILGDGRRGQGVVKARHWLKALKRSYHARLIIRPATSDLA